MCPLFFIHLFVCFLAKILKFVFVQVQLHIIMKANALITLLSIYLVIIIVHSLPFCF